MFGSLGIGELLIILFVVLPLICLPFLLLGLFLRRMLGRRSEVEELRARVAELEAKRPNTE